MSTNILQLSQLLVSIVESTQCLWPVGVKTATLWDLVDDFLMKKTLPTICHDLENRLFKGLLHQVMEVSFCARSEINGACSL